MRKLAVVLLVAAASAAFASPKKIGGVQNETGDVKITCIGNYIVAEPMVVVLQPSKDTVPDTNAVYAVECRIVYRDKVNPPPTTRRGLARYALVCDFLNDCLQGFVRQECAGWDFSALLEDYRSGDFANRLQGKSFPEYISKCAEQYAKTKPKFRFGVEINAVSVQAISDFASALNRAHASGEAPKDPSAAGKTKGE